MLTLTSHKGKHCLKRESRLRKFVRRYQASHKPVHLSVTGGFFAIELVAVILHVEMIYHIAISSSVTVWESLVITLSEE